MRCLNWKTLAISTSPLAHTGRQSPQEERKGTVEAKSQEELSAYQEMTPKEAADVMKLMEEYKPFVNNSMAFAEQLSKDLHVLDEVRGPRAVSQPQRRCLVCRSTGLCLWASPSLSFAVST